jgi:DNA-binding HxlR family transcriptional regulator
VEEDGYVERKVYPVVPPKTEYSLTKNGEEILKLINIIKNYGLKMIQDNDVTKNIYSKTRLKMI